MYKCINNLVVEVMRSACGFYVGTSDEDGCPNCRVSGYYKTRELAQKALDTMTFNRIAEENLFCSGAYGCSFRVVEEPQPNECDHSVFEPQGCPIYSNLGRREKIHCLYPHNPSECPEFKRGAE